MIVDVYTEVCDDALIEDIDEIIEDSMVQMFIAHPKDLESLLEIQELAQEHNAIFYAAPLSLKAHCDDNCVAYEVDDTALIETADKPLFIDAKLIDEKMLMQLSSKKGIIMNADQSYSELEGFFISLGLDTVDSFDLETLAAFSMQKLVLHSRYPQYDFSAPYQTAKKISDCMFRPEQSIIAEATKNALVLFGFKK